MTSPASSHERLVIIGAGPAGYTAAIYAARAMLKPLLLSGFEPGGQLMITTDVENYPGFADPIQGPWLMEQMRLQAEHVGARLENEHVTALDLSRRPFRIQCDSGRVVFAESLILATGAKAKWLGLPERAAPARASASRPARPATASSSGARRVVVVGGGNSAVEEALYLSQLAAVGHGRAPPRSVPRRAHPDRAPRRAAERQLQMEPHGRGNRRRRTAARRHRRAAASDTKTGAIEEIETDGVFVAIGHAPATELVRGQLALKPNGYVQTTPGSTETSVEGVFAAGDVADDIFRQAVTAAGLGCMAALEADRWLAAQAPERVAAE